MRRTTLSFAACAGATYGNCTCTRDTYTNTQHTTSARTQTHTPGTDITTLVHILSHTHHSLTPNTNQHNRFDDTQVTRKSGFAAVGGASSGHVRGHAWAPEIGKGASITTFDNPQNQRFEVVTFSPPAVAHVALQGQRQAQDSFYPGYTWRLVTCAKCGAHLGWKFEPVKKKKAAATCSIEGDGQTTAHSHDHGHSHGHDHGHGHAEGGTGTEGGNAEGGEDNDEDDEDDDEAEEGAEAEEDDELDVVHIEGEGSKSDLDLGFLKGTQKKKESRPVCVNVRKCV